MYKAVAAIILVAIGAPAWAQMTPEGLWRNVDDKTGEAKAEIRIRDTGAGGLLGVLEKRLSKDAKPDDVCKECTDDRKDKPVLGMTIIRNIKANADDKGIWDGGDILDPNNGKVYRARLKPVDGGKKLEMRGYLGPFYRTQVWLRVE